MKQINRNFVKLGNIKKVIILGILIEPQIYYPRFFFNSLELQLWAWNILYSSVVCYAPGVSTRTFRPNVMEKNFKEF